PFPTRRPSDLAMLKESLPSPMRRVAGGVLVATLVFGSAFAAWASLPQQRRLADGPVEKIVTETPAYPESAREQRISGKVLLVIDVAADGSVVKAAVERSEPSGVFDQAVLSSVSKWKFNPEIKDGVPVPSRLRFPVEFKMAPPEPEKAGG